MAANSQDAYQAASVLESAGARIVQKGCFQGETLGSLSPEKLDIIQRSRTRGAHADFCRAFANSKRAMDQLEKALFEDEAKHGSLVDKSMDELAIVPYVSLKRSTPLPRSHDASPSFKESKVIKISIFGLINRALKQVLGGNFGQLATLWVLTSSFLGMCFVSFIACLCYPPLGAVPARIIGIVIRIIVDRSKLACSFFVSALYEEIGNLLHDIYLWILPFFPSLTTDFPIGQTILLGAVTFCVTKVLSLPIITCSIP